MQTKRMKERAAFFTLTALLAGLVMGCEPSKPAQDARDARLGEPLPQASLVTPEPEDPGTVGLSSEIKKVTVFSDRALVTREARAKVTSEATVYAFKHLPGWVDDGSVRAASSAGRIVEVRVGRTYLARDTDPTFRKAEAEVRALTARMGALDDELKVLDAQAKQIAEVRAFSMEKLPKDVLVDKLGVQNYASVVDYVTSTLRETAKARREVEAERVDLTPAVETKKRRLEELKGMTQIEETTVYVTLQGTASADAAVTLTYMLPGATWEPVHELRTDGAGASSVEVSSFAVVTQASGEDWSNAELAFSTQSSTAAVSIPQLGALTLGDTRAATQTMERKEASFSRAETAFRVQNRLWNLRLQGSEQSQAVEEIYKTNFEALQVVQSKTVQIFQSLQQRGTTAQFKALGATKVRADGRSVRVPIGRAHLQAKQAIVAAPEQSLNAAITLDMRNETGQALLPGAVGLYQGSSFLGMTNLDFVADGESFSMFLGVADQLKMSRALDRKHSALVRKQHTQMQLAFVVTVENLSGKPVTLTLADRVPVSEEREIVISNVKISPDAKPDSKGILKWQLTLQPKEKRQIDIRYQIEYPPSLVLEMKRQQAAEASHPPHPSPAGHASPSPRGFEHDVKKDIQKLEQSF
ncbi:Aspartate ammonia-lyase [Minicystis rosea]|nr:Aspartate ammonia-lyase [Minicystis rosea]